MGLKIGYWNLCKKSANYPNICRAIYAMLNSHRLDMIFLVDFNINFIKPALCNPQLTKKELKINPLAIVDGYIFQKFHERKE
jgi:hypothetical protein